MHDEAVFHKHKAQDQEDGNDDFPHGSPPLCQCDHQKQSSDERDGRRSQTQEVEQTGLVGFGGGNKHANFSFVLDSSEVSSLLPFEAEIYG